MNERRAEWIEKALRGIALAQTVKARKDLLGSLYDVAAADGAIVGAKAMAQRLTGKEVA